MELFVTISNSMLPLIIVAKFSILDVRGAPDYTSAHEPVLLISNIADEKKTEIRKNLIIPHCPFYVIVQAYKV